MTERNEHPQIDPRELRRAFGAFATGVTVVTTFDQAQKPWGFTANSFTSVSLDPPLLLVCLAKSAGSFPVFAQTQHFAINILAADQRDLSNAFATAGADKYAATSWQARTTGSPVLDGVAAWLDCVTHDLVDAGDHLVLIGRVVDFDHSDTPPLGYCRGAYVSFGLSLAAAEARETDSGTQVGALIEHEGALLLRQVGKSEQLSLPTAPRIGDANDPRSLLGGLATAGLHAALPFIYAVYEDDAGHWVFYRGTVAAEPAATLPGGLVFVPLGEIPWDRIGDPAVKTMIQRYIEERDLSGFGLYVGTAEGGRIHSVTPQGG